MFRVYFVARTNRSRRPFRNSPTNFSLVPPVYRFAVSTKFPPASAYASKIPRLSSFDAPQPHSSPNVIVPRHSSETRRPVLPSNLKRIAPLLPNSAETGWSTIDDPARNPLLPAPPGFPCPTGEIIFPGLFPGISASNGKEHRHGVSRKYDHGG